MFTVVLDAGHGGHDPGAVNVSRGLRESDMALDVMLRARDLLATDCKVVMTRVDDRFLPLRERPAIANSVDADLFVSGHFNSGDSGATASSFEGFTTRGQNESDKACEMWIKHHGKLFPEQKLRSDRSDGDSDKEMGLAVLRPTKCPAYLCEFEFIHTEHGADLIESDSNRQKMALGVARAVAQYGGFTLAYDRASEGALERLMEDLELTDDKISINRGPGDLVRHEALPDVMTIKRAKVDADVVLKRAHAMMWQLEQLINEIK